MSSTMILAIVIGILLVIIIVLLLTGNRSNDREQDVYIPPSNEDKFNTTFTPNTAINQTAPLEKGRKKDKKPAAFVNEAQLSTAGKDETFLPQTASTPNEQAPSQDDEPEALTEMQSKD